MTKAFEKLEFDRRGTKPRDNGLTMMIDWGIGVHQQKDLLDLTNQYVDLAKIAVGLSGIIDEKNCEKK